MSTLGAIVNLGAQLVVFISAASLFLVVSTTPEFLGATARGRALLRVAAVLLAAGAIARGSAPEMDPTTAWLMVVRLAAVVFLAFGITGVTNRAARSLLATAAGFLAAGLVLRSTETETLANVLVGMGGLAIGIAAALGARRSIGARIAAATTALLLVVVLVLSAVLSVVLSSNISDEALRRAEDRAADLALRVASRADDAIAQANFLARSLGDSAPFRDSVRTGNFDALNVAVSEFLSVYPAVDFIAYANPQGAPVRTGIEEEEVLDVVGSQVVLDGLSGSAAASVSVTGQGLVALAAIPVALNDARGAPQLVGAVITGSRIDSDLLNELVQGERGTVFSVVARDRVLATTGDNDAKLNDLVGLDISGALGSIVLDQGRPVSKETNVQRGEAFVAAAPITTSDARPIAAFIVSIDADLVSSTLTSVFRTLFLVALAATAAAFILATVMGARVSAPLRRLTAAAERIASGDLTARAEIEAHDEIGVLGGSFDTMTTSIERMTREIREAAAQTAAILGGMAEGLVATAPDGTIVALNSAAEQMLGVKEGRALGKPVEAVIKGTDQSGRALAERLGASLSKSWSVHGTISRRRGGLAVAMSGAPIRDERGTLVGRVYVMRDIQREAEVEAMKSEFLANISHELRTPLTPIKGYTEMMLAKDLPKDRQKVFLGTMLESAERLERYVDMLVNFSAMEAGRFELATSEVNVAEIVRRVGERWKGASKAHKIVVKPGTRVPSVTADERLLERTVNELVDNAIKYSPEGGAVEIESRMRGSGASRRVEISVADKGIGIERADLDEIFSEFAQLDGSSTRRFGGLGLGLSFVNRVVDAHQGTLEATSTPGGGSVFTISLPPAREVARPRRRAAKPDRPKGRKPARR